ncbi:hypothetical protein GCM10009736_56430 [Actinomadura bangladeshensis]
MMPTPGGAAPLPHTRNVSGRGQYAPRPAPSMHARPTGPLGMDLDIDQALDDLRRAFPDICIWHGEWSGSLWALLPDRLVEARTAADLARRLRRIRPHTRAGFAAPCRPTSSTRRPDGTWSISPTPSPKPIRNTLVHGRCRRVTRLFVTCLRLAGLSAWFCSHAW